MFNKQKKKSADPYEPVSEEEDNGPSDLITQSLMNVRGKT